MIVRNCIELGVIIVMLGGMSIWKQITGKKVSHLDGLGEINKDGPERGEIIGD